MSTIYLIRHGQASLGTSNYDQLSPLGKQQAEVLGQYFSSLNIAPDCIIQGELNRHRQTTLGILEGLGKEYTAKENSIISDRRWNEFDFEALIHLYVSQNNIDTARLQSPADFFGLLKKALLAWSSNELGGDIAEDWESFVNRVDEAITDLRANQAENIFVVSSGGAISMAIKHILGLSNRAMIELNLQSRNSGVTELAKKRDKLFISSLNHVAHLSTSENKKMITHA